MGHKMPGVHAQLVGFDLGICVLIVRVCQSNLTSLNSARLIAARLQLSQ